MRIGKYQIFDTVAFIAPKSEKVTFDVGPKGAFTAKFTAIITWTDQDPDGLAKGDQPSANWKLETKDGKTEITIQFVNLKLPLGGAFDQFAKVGNLGSQPFGFMATCHTHGESASFSIQFMLEVGDE
jgi:hypothetical protein